MKDLYRFVRFLSEGHLSSLSSSLIIYTESLGERSARRQSDNECHCVAEISQIFSNQTLKKMTLKPHRAQPLPSLTGGVRGWVFNL